MFAVSLLFYIYFVHFSSAFHGASTGNLFGFVFGFQKLCLCRCGVSQRHISDTVRSGRLLGGESLSPHQFPWLVAVSTGVQTFGGSLLSDRHVITAASPLYGIPAGGITVTLGAHDRCSSVDPALNSSIASVFIHPAFSPTHNNNNIAILRLRHTVPFSQFISPICMPYYGTQESGQVAWTAGWVEDSTKTCTPRVATLPILPSRACLKGSLDAKLVTSDKGCLGPLGAKSVICKADVGSPVMIRWTNGASFRLVGVMSSSSSCDEQVTPLFTRVSDHAAWIYDHLRSDCQCF